MPLRPSCIPGSTRDKSSSILRPDNESSLLQSRHDDRAFSLVEQVLRDAVRDVASPENLQPGDVVLMLDFGHRDLGNLVAVNCNGETPDGIAAEKTFVVDGAGNLYGIAQGAVAANSPILSEREGGAAGAHEVDLNLELVGQPEIIAVEEGEVLAESGANAAIASLCDPNVLFERKNANPGIVGGKLTGKHQCAVPGGIVDDDQFPVAVGLGQDGLNRLAE